jgi:uncharacterized repeat protein (TIGR01451 family)
MKIFRGLALTLITLVLAIGLLTIIRAEAGPAAPTGALVTLSQTTVADFNQGSFYLTGMTRNGDGEVTLLQLGIAGEWLTNTNATGLVPRFEHASIVYSKWVYVFGGRTPSGLRSIQFSTINSTTHNLSNWLTATTSLTTSIYTYTLSGDGVVGLSAVQLGGRVYLLGGKDDSRTYYYNKVTFAALDPNTGQLGPLITTTPLPQGLSNGQAIVLNGRIYYLGGIYTSSIKATDTVYYATPDLATGAITAWYTTTARLPYKTFGQMAAVTANGRIYSMAGISNTTFIGTAPDAYFAEPTASGDITGWIAAQPVPRSIYGGAAVSFAGQVYNAGGALDGSILGASSYVVAGLDSLSTGVNGWVNTSGITPSRELHTAVVNSDGWLYIVGGSNGANLPIQQSIINIAATTGKVGVAYAPDGNFLARPFDFGSNYILHSLSWVATLPVSTSAALRYRTALNGGAYSSWSVLYPATSGTGLLTTTRTITSVARYLQYQVFLTTTSAYTSPALNQVNVTAEIPTPPTFRKSANPASGSSVEPGDRITYTLVYSNIGDNAISGVVIADPVPTTTTYVTGSIFGPAGVTANALDPAQLSWSIATLPPHSGGTLGFVVTVNSNVPEGSIIYNAARFNSDLANLSSNTTYHTVGLPPELVKSHVSSAPAQAQGQVQPGDIITYTLTYTNPNQSQPFLNTFIADSLPLGITYLGSIGSITPTVSLQSGHQVLQWSVGTVPTLTQGTVGFYAQVVTDTTLVPNGGSIDNMASGTAGERQFSSNIDSVPVRYRFDLIMSKSDDRAFATGGSILAYTIRITNVTSVPITPTGIVVTDSLQPGIPTGQLGVLQCVAPCAGWAFAGSGGDGSLMYSRTIPFLGPNQTAILTLTAQVSPTLLTDAPGVLAVANQVSALDDGQQGIEVNLLNQTAVDTDTIGLPPELTKSHISSAPAVALGQVQPGDIVTYTLVYRNPSPTQPMLNTILTDSLPLGITYLGNVGSPAPTVSSQGGHQVLQWSVGTVPTQTQGSVGFYARVAADTTLVPNGGSIDNMASGTADEWQFSSNADNVPVRYRFDLMLSKNDGITRAVEGSILTYTIQITNVTSMPITPTGIIVTDSLQPGSPTNQPGVLQCIAPCTGWSFNGVNGDGSLVYSRIISSLGPNQSIVVTMVAQISPTLLSDAPDVLAVANSVSALDDGQQGIEVNLLNQTAIDTDTIGLPPELAKSHISSAPAVALGQVQPGDVITYTLVYTNQSLVQPVLNTIITDSLPPGITYLGHIGSPAPTVSLQGGQQVLQWSVGTVPTQTQGSVGFYARVAADTTLVPNGGSIDNMASGTADEWQFSSNADNVPVRYRFDLMLSKNDGIIRAAEGSILTYTIQITNVTSVPVTPTGIIVTDSLQPGSPTNQPGVLHCVAPCTGWSFNGVNGDGSLVYSRIIPYLGPNQSIVVTMVAQISPTLLSDAPDVLAVANQVSAVDDGLQGIEVDPLNQTAVDTDVVSGPDIVVTDLHAASSAIIPGKSTQFVVTLFNSGFVATTNSVDGTGWFGVDLYIKPVGSPPPTGPADRFLGYCRDTSNDPCTQQLDHYLGVGYPSGGLAAGETISLTYNLSITLAGTYWLYVQADPYWAGSVAPYSAGTPAHGRIVEGDEANNIFGPIVITVDYVRVYLPIIMRSH